MTPLISKKKLAASVYGLTSGEVSDIFNAIEYARAHEFDAPKGGYREGDVVEWCGREGIVVTVINYEYCSIRVAFEIDRLYEFTLDGRHSKNFGPRLKFISRPAKCETHEPVSATELLCRTCGLPIEASGWRVKV